MRKVEGEQKQRDAPDVWKKFDETPVIAAPRRILKPGENY
jgi:hypothetical protein